MRNYEAGPVVAPWAFVACIWISLAPGIAASDQTLKNEGLARIVATFDALEEASVDAEEWKAYTNEDGALAWGTSYILEAYLDMYEATRDRKYLTKFITLAVAMVERTDDRRGLPDYKGRRRLGWGAVKYSRASERVVWLVHTGMITYPLLRLTMIVRETPTLTGLAETVRRFQNLTEQALHEFDGQWRYDSLARLGHYVYEDDEPHGDHVGTEMPVPFNQQLAAGRAFILLWKLTGDSAYRQRAEGLARHFKKHLREDSRGAYQWDYWYGKGLLRYKLLEDLSHGAIDVDFTVLAMRESLIFTRNDLARFVSAFFRDTNAHDGKMLEPNDAVGRWLELAEVECGVYRVVMPYLMSMTGTQHSQVLLGVAKLAKYAAICARS